MRDAFEVRSYKKGDETGINDSFNEVFRLNRALEEWEWKFKKPIAAVAKINNNIIGHIAAVKLPLIEGGTLCSIVDVFVLPRYRRIGVLQKLFANIYPQCPKLIAFPNKQSYPFFIKEGWKEECELDHFVKRISIYSALKKRIGPFAIIGKLYNLLPKQQDDFQISLAVPKSYEGLWQKNKPAKGILKNSEYFKWRYDENPNSFYYLFNNNGLVVINIIENRARALECIGQYIHAERWLLHKGVEYIEFIGHGFQIPYKKVKSKKRVLVSRNYSLDKVTFGDTDVI